MIVQAAACASLYTKHLSTKTVTYLLADKACYLPRGETGKGSCKDKIRHKDKMKRWLAEKQHKLKGKIERWSYFALYNRCNKDPGTDRDTKGDCVGKGNSFETKFLCEEVCKLQDK